MRMPKNKDEFEIQMLWAFKAGIVAGYGVEHTNITEDEENAITEFAETYGFKRKSLPK